MTSKNNSVACPECGSKETQNSRRVWHKVNGKRVQVMQMQCKSCGRYFRPKK